MIKIKGPNILAFSEHLIPVIVQMRQLDLPTAHLTFPTSFHPVFSAYSDLLCLCLAKSCCCFSPAPVDLSQQLSCKSPLLGVSLVTCSIVCFLLPPSLAHTWHILIYSTCTHIEILYTHYICICINCIHIYTRYMLSKWINSISVPIWSSDRILMR